MNHISQFLKHHYRHFNSAALIDAAEAYKTHLASGGYMMATLAGAMSTCLWPKGTPRPHGTTQGKPDHRGGYALKQEWL